MLNYGPRARDCDPSMVAPLLHLSCTGPHPCCRWPDAAMQFTPSTPTRLPFNEPFAWTRPGVAHRSFLKALVEEDSKVQAQF